MTPHLAAVATAPGRSSIALGDGAVVDVRAIAPSDTCLLKALYDCLSPWSRYLRFQHAVAEVTPSEAARLCAVDMDNEVAIVACTVDASGPRLVAEARYVVLPGAREAELALAVADEWQRRGLGARMLDLLMRHAMSRGIERLLGYALSENLAMRKLAVRRGARLRLMRGGTSEVCLEFALRPLPRAPGAEDFPARQRSSVH